MSEIVTNPIAPEDITLDAAVSEERPTPNPAIEQGIALDEALKPPEPAAEEQEKADAAAPKEPRYVQKRIAEALEKAVPKAIQEAVAQVRAEYEKQIAPLREAQLNRDADDLVKSGEFKNRDRALEYLRLKQGVPPVQQTQEQPRDDGGKFAKAPDNTVKARAEMLMQQAKTIQELTGTDILAAFNSDPVLKQKVISGEWDFIAAAKSLQSPTPIPTAGAQAAPSPVRTANSATPQQKPWDKLTHDDLENLNKKLEQGWRVR